MVGFCEQALDRMGNVWPPESDVWRISGATIEIDYLPHNARIKS
jgi:hypothetical protein